MRTKILIIDDDSAVTDLLKLMLCQGPFDVNVTNTAMDGIANVKRWNPDVVVLDLLMPGEDGWTTCKEIRRFSQVPILIMSALNNPGIHTKVLEEGADDFLIKPVSKNVFIAHLKKLAWRAQAEARATQ